MEKCKSGRMKKEGRAHGKKFNYLRGNLVWAGLVEFRLINTW